MPNFLSHDTTSRKIVQCSSDPEFAFSKAYTLETLLSISTVHRRFIFWFLSQHCLRSTIRLSQGYLFHKKYTNYNNIMQSKRMKQLLLAKCACFER